MIQALETGGMEYPDAAIGNDGERGRYQIRAIFVRDVNRIAGTRYAHMDAHDPEKAAQMVRIWHEHYGASDTRMISMARRHNGGPNGHTENGTLWYASRAARWVVENAGKGLK
jgi:hypothetical protein